MSFTVIIPSRNAENLVQCLERVATNEPQALSIIVDDGIDWQQYRSLEIEVALRSPAETFTRMGNCRLIGGERPFIFSRNVNLGIRESMSHPWCEGTIVLNDDALLETPGGFSLMAQAAREHPEYGIIASTCDNVGNPRQFPAAGSSALIDEPRMVCFVCVYIPRTTIERVGLLDERYVGYGMDDDDYCFSVRRRGLKLGIHQGCFVNHSKLHSSFRGLAGAGGDYRPNLELFKQKWGMDNWGRPA